MSLCKLLALPVANLDIGDYCLSGKTICFTVLGYFLSSLCSVLQKGFLQSSVKLLCELRASLGLLDLGVCDSCLSGKTICFTVPGFFRVRFARFVLLITSILGIRQICRY